MKPLSLSIIIPTRNRAKELGEILNCTLCQTVFPKEVVIVDDSDSLEIANLIHEKQNQFKFKQIELKYFRNFNGQSLTIARNFGVRLVNSEIILFLDDDVILDNKYIEELLKVYNSFDKAIGVQGIIRTNGNSAILNAFNKVFYLSYTKPDTWKILPSAEEIFPFPLTKTINCPRLSGANHSYRRIVFQSLIFDEALKGYGFGEDKDFSFRVFKKFGNHLYITPFARLVHKESPSARQPSKVKIYMKTINNLYFLYKNLSTSNLNEFKYWWSRIGELLAALCMTLSISANTIQNLHQIKFLIRSYFYVIKHRSEIKNGQLRFFESFLRKRQ